MNKLIGKKITFFKKIGKRTKRTRTDIYKEVIYEWEVINLLKPETGIICGKRRKIDGFWTEGDSSENAPSSIYFQSTKDIDCYLIAVSLNQTVLCPVEYCLI